LEQKTNIFLSFLLLFKNADIFQGKNADFLFKARSIHTRRGARHGRVQPRQPRLHVLHARNVKAAEAQVAIQRNLLLLGGAQLLLEVQLDLVGGGDLRVCARGWGEGGRSR
jgi:hypothetical protein